MIRRFAAYYKPHKKLFFMDMACAMVMSCCTLFYPVVTRRMINIYIPQGRIGQLLFWAAVLLGIYLLKAVLHYIIQYYGHVMGVRIQVDMRRDAFSHLQKLPFAYFDETKTGVIMSRIINDTFEITELAHHGPEDLFISGITLIGSFVFLCSVNVCLTLIIFAFVPLLAWFAIRKRIRLSEASKQSRIEVAEVNADLENSVAGIRISKAYKTEDHELDKFQRNNKAYESARGVQYQAMGVFFSGTGLIMDILILVTLVSGGLFAYNGIINFGDLAAFLLFVGLFTDPIKRLINFVEQFQSGITGFERLTELMREAPEEDDPQAEVLESTSGHILLDRVTFHYDDKAVLKDLSLEIRSGETVALVGPSGGGKTTLCHLIPRFYEIDDGAIYLDGRDIRGLTRGSLRQHIGIVQQDTFLFTGTIRDNIAYGNLQADDEQIIAAAKQANIHSFIRELPDGYDTFVGERGVKLSGGQKQRISIARVFLKNPSILILDEATSALDNTTERLIQEALDQLSKGRTTLIVAHRLSTVRRADKIVVLTDEGILQQGSHDQLLAQGGLYAQLYEAQFQE